MNHLSPSLLNTTFPRNRQYPLSHLKRFAKREALPAAFRATLPKPKGRGKHIPTLFGFIPPHTPDGPLPDAEQIQQLLAPYAPETYGTTKEPCPSDIKLYKTKIPFQAPFTERQSNKWSKTIWPMSWNPAVPRSTAVPPPAVLNSAQESIESLSGYYLALAQKVARAAKESGRGRGVGAVIVDPRLEAEIDHDAWLGGYEPIIRWMDKVVAVAEDARFARSEGGQPSQADLHTGKSLNPACMYFDPDTEGGPDLHALMRGVELVALCRRLHADEATFQATSQSDQVGVHTDPQLTKELSELESYFLKKELIKPPPTAPQATTTPTLEKVAEDKMAENKEEKAGEAKEPDKKKRKQWWYKKGKKYTRSASRSASPELNIKTPANTYHVDLSCPSMPSYSQDGDSPASPTSTRELSTDSHIPGRADGGYLCAELDVYLSHEPCWTCSMGVCLSRFRAVIFPRSGRMKTGGLSTEPITSGLEMDSDEEDCGHEHRVPPKDVREKYYGMHYREELNWRALGFEFIEEEEKPPMVEWDDNVEFHA